MGLEWQHINNVNILHYVISLISPGFYNSLYKLVKYLLNGIVLWHIYLHWIIIEKLVMPEKFSMWWLIIVKNKDNDKKMSEYGKDDNM